MVLLHPVADFLDSNTDSDELTANYYYEGLCPQTGEILKLPRTPLVEAIAFGLMRQLEKNYAHVCEGKMYGVLLVEIPTGEKRVLKAFSGLLNGDSVVTGWVPPIPGREDVALQEALTLANLEAIKQQLIRLNELPERAEYARLSLEFQQLSNVLANRHLAAKQKRQEKRSLFTKTLTGEMLNIALETLDEESRQDGIDRRHFKVRQNEVLAPFKQIIMAADQQMQVLKQQRKQISRQLQAQMQRAYTLTNFSGKSLSLQTLMPGGLMPTGTGDCCAPKLLHYAATNGLKPLAMAEFWWGLSSVNQDKISGNFYGACLERCQPLMGFLLSGLSQIYSPHFPFKKEDQDFDLSIIYEDEWLIALNKPPGLLSVPGRYFDSQDSVLSRLRNSLSDGINLMPVHRLDQETSGILLLARDRQTYGQISLQFQQRQVYKVYEAILSGVVKMQQGIIELPLWGNPENRPYQQVDQNRGKPCVTKFQIIAKEGEFTRVEFIPLTGRTHQLRVHAADYRGLGVTILGDRLYGCKISSNRLHLHARELRFRHPYLGKTLHLQIETPF